MIASNNTFPTTLAATTGALGVGVALGFGLRRFWPSVAPGYFEVPEPEPESVGDGGVYSGRLSAMPEALREEFFARSVSYFNEPGMAMTTGGFGALQDAFVVVVGLGGVGSHAAHMLARGGIGRLRLIDFDQVTLSSLNRHATAMLADVGRPKVTALREALLDRAPTCEVHAVNRMFTAEAAATLLADWGRPVEAGRRPRPVYVLDCIDDLNTKAELLAACRARGLRVLASMGAGGKADPTRVRIGELADCIKDPIASKLRWKLRKLDPEPEPGHKDRMSEGIYCVYSCERTQRGLLPLTEEQKRAPKEFGTVENFRLRVIPVLGTMPAIMGQAMAAYVLSELGQRPFEPGAVEGSLSKGVRNKLLGHLTTQEARYAYGGDRLAAARNLGVDMNDVEFVVSEVWRGKSPLSGVKFISKATFVLMRWRRDGPCDPSNLLCCTVQEAEAYNAALDEGQTPERFFGQESVDRIDARLAFMAPEY